MTQRKPPGISFETWIDRQIRDATERGEFDDLPGRGKPIADLDQPSDELWWVRQLMQRENLSYLPPTLALRKEVEDGRAAAAHAATAKEARRIVAALNDKIRAANRMVLSGPPLNLAPFDLDAVEARWRADHPVDPGAGEPGTTEDEPAAGPDDDLPPPRHRPRWRRRLRRG